MNAKFENCYCGNVVFFFLSYLLRLLILVMSLLHSGLFYFINLAYIAAEPILRNLSISNVENGEPQKLSFIADLSINWYNYFQICVTVL